jgi:hypothetical protein
MEAAGIEPASAAAPVWASTGIAHPLISPGRPVCERPTAGPAILLSHPSGDWLSIGASPFMTPLPEPRAESGATRHLTRLGGECEISIRTYVISRLFYEADRGPRPAAQPENRPRRDLVAPVCTQVNCSRVCLRARPVEGEVLARATRPLELEAEGVATVRSRLPPSRNLSRADLGTGSVVQLDARVRRR